MLINSFGSTMFAQVFLHHWGSTERWDLKCWQTLGLSNDSSLWMSLIWFDSFTLDFSLGGNLWSISLLDFSSLLIDWLKVFSINFNALSCIRRGKTKQS